MPIQLNVLERTIFFSLNQAPAPGRIRRHPLRMSGGSSLIVGEK